MSQRWSPLKAALVVFGIVVVIGIVAFVVFASADGVIHNSPFARGRSFGTGIGALAALAGAAAYLIQSRRR